MKKPAMIPTVKCPGSPSKFYVDGLLPRQDVRCPKSGGHWRVIVRGAPGNHVVVDLAER